MTSFARIILCSLIFLAISSQSVTARAEAGREFLLSCTYGVLAGALVGAASLAVEDDPSSKIHRVARGASLGLYTGILLGLYVVYVVPAQMEAKEQELLDEQMEDVVEPDDYGLNLKVRPIARPIIRYQAPKFTVYPVFEQNKVTGAAFAYNVINF